MRAPHYIATLAFIALLAAGHVCLADDSKTKASPTREQCEALAEHMKGVWPDASTRLAEARFYDAPRVLSISTAPGRAPVEVTLPAHCEVLGVLHERVGALGQRYAIHFHLRLPANWNQRFFFQGGGGTNGEIGNALGVLGTETAPALLQGYAVVSQDSGHDNAINSDPMRGGTVAFGFDHEARADYGHASLEPVAQAAKAIIKIYYEQSAKFSYFAGCSKGGAEGMAMAQRYPQEFDGVLASAPGFSLPRAAVTEAWDVQALALAGDITTPQAVARTFTDADLSLASKAVLKACDAADGLQDGIVGAFGQCSTKKVHPELMRLRCVKMKATDCLSSGQIAALERIFGGPRDANGKALYSDWPWDPGLASVPWRMWKMGTADGAMPAFNIALGGASLASVFTTPPTALRDDLQMKLDYARRFDFQRDAQKIYATDAQFPQSSWDDISARSSDLSAFRARGGKLIVPHGVADPVFSINDTLSWYRDVNQREKGAASTFVRVFPVPGMAHCGGGPATDRYDAFGALVKWVERGEAPEQILARAGPDTPWPGRERPLCAYPRIASYKGSGSSERAESFACR